MKLSRTPHPFETVLQPSEYPYAGVLRSLSAIAFLLVMGLMIGACALTAEQKRRLADTEMKLGQTAEYIAKRAASIAGRVVINAAVGQLQDSDANFLDSAAAGLRSQVPDLVTATDVATIVQIWTKPGPQWSHLAVQLADTYHEATRDREIPKAAVIEALATGLNAAAAQDRLP